VRQFPQWLICRSKQVPNGSTNDLRIQTKQRRHNLTVARFRLLRDRCDPTSTLFNTSRRLRPENSYPLRLQKSVRPLLRVRPKNLTRATDSDNQRTWYLDYVPAKKNWGPQNNTYSLIDSPVTVDFPL
jgi:hypothetical protein